jgi:hypothetical protein
MTDDTYHWENPGPNMSWCPQCQAWKMLAVIKVQGDKASIATWPRHCATCGARLEDKPI